MKRLFNVRPVPIAAAGLCLGLLFMFAALRGGISVGIILLCAFAAPCMALPFLFIKKSFVKAFFMCFATAVFAVIGFFSLYSVTEKYKNAGIPEAEYTVSGTVESVTDYGDGYKRAVLKNLTFEKGEVKTKYKLSLTMYGAEKVMRGDRIVFTSFVYNYGLFYENKISVYNIGGGVKFFADAGLYDYEIHDGKKNVFDTVYAFIANRLEGGLSESEFPLALALMTGDGSFMEDNLLANFRAGGAAHIFAVSGLHIGFLAAVVSLPLRRTKYARAVIVPPILFFYSGVCGFTASSLRAAIMISVALIARCFGEKYDSVSALSLSAAIVLLISPFELFSAGFALSFSVVLSMLMLARKIARLLKFMPDKLALALGTVFAAQIGSVPPSLYYFGTVSAISVAVNLVLVPAVSVLFTSLFIGIFVNWLFLQNYFVRLVRLVFELFDFGVFSVKGAFPAWLALPYYLLIAVIAKFFGFDKKPRRIISAALAFVICLSFTIVGINGARETEIAVTSSSGLSAVSISRGNESVVLVTHADEYFNSGNLRRYLNKRNIKKVDKLIIADSSINVHGFVTAFHAATEISSVYYTAEYPPDLLEDYFDGAIKFSEVWLGETLETAAGDFAFTKENVTVFDCGLRIIAVGEGVEDAFVYECDVLIVPEVNDLPSGDFSEILSFGYGGDYPSSAKDGNLIYKISKGRLKRL